MEPRRSTSISIPPWLITMVVPLLIIIVVVLVAMATGRIWILPLAFAFVWLMAGLIFGGRWWD